MAGVCLSLHCAWESSSGSLGLAGLKHHETKAVRVFPAVAKFPSPGAQITSSTPRTLASPRAGTDCLRGRWTPEEPERMGNRDRQGREGRKLPCKAIPLGIRGCRSCPREVASWLGTQAWVLPSNSRQVSLSAKPVGSGHGRAGPGAAICRGSVGGSFSPLEKQAEVTGILSESLHG